ncbi:FAD-dependent oxidoreductase [Sphingobium lignivorans]|uniref:Thioredoxin reductase n=1 Tax=Sphingobium lignivorans TaxID=2735886 RepID=A0ABR6NBV1_9SPHN|nr:FAD-dependent oxidoreductase [Sphingobium lignivorans]MBB5984752.1 thioredoxin reductase (NADPH) [Sphingobium lignivorans]
MSVVEERAAQLFPVLDKTQIEIASRFASGPARRFGPGEALYTIGDTGDPAWLVLEGCIEAIRRDGIAGEALIHRHGPGELSGEVNQLAGRPSLASGRAGEEGCLALPFDAPHLRALMVGAAELGETIMRALILRRVGLIEEGAGSILIGRPGSADLVRIQNFLTRSGYPHLVLDADAEGEGHDLVAQLGVGPADLPIMVCPNGSFLKRPQDVEVAACLGMAPEISPDTLYDVAIVGAGPAGLAAAVYAASEGLSVLVLDERSFGGQAGASMRIENYLGFPTGITGQALAGRAFNQALKFGAEIAIPNCVSHLDCGGDDGVHQLVLAGDERARARTVIIASGARYRRPDIPGIEAFDNVGISYWASPIEAKLVQGQVVGLVGGGNSAGQAAVYLAPFVERLHLVVRRPLEATMSQYLIERIASQPNIEVHVGKEISSLEGPGDGSISAASFRCRTHGEIVSQAMQHLFLFIGAEPNADWTRGCVATDPGGFILTGRDIPGDARTPGNDAQSLETSMPGVFAIGDVRAGSTKRVAAAVGEGAAVVAQIHQALQAAR